jgi:hypothetical protein
MARSTAADEMPVPVAFRFASSDGLPIACAM